MGTFNFYHLWQSKTMPLKCPTIIYRSIATLGFGSFAPKPAIFCRAGGRRRPPLCRDDGPAHSDPARNLSGDRAGAAVFPQHLGGQKQR
jgi:hypothetical protein